MNRLHKKCFVVSAGFHLLLALILVVGPAFLASSEKPVPAQYIDIIPLKIIEAPFAGGGEPNVKPPPPTPPAQQQQRTPQQQPEPTPKLERVKKPDPVKPDPEALEPSNQIKKHRVEISKELVDRNQDSKTKPRQPSQAELQAQARAENQKLAAQLLSAAENLRGDFASRTKVGVPGPGGEAYAGYEIVLQSIYKKHYDQALAAAGDIATGHSAVEVSVVIAREGKVVSSRILTPSGNSALDRLVRRVLDSVTSVRPFPEGSKDAQRTFTIVFDLKPQGAIG